MLLKQPTKPKYKRPGLFNPSPEENHLPPNPFTKEREKILVFHPGVLSFIFIRSCLLLNISHLISYFVSPIITQLLWHIYLYTTRRQKMWSDHSYSYLISSSPVERRLLIRYLVIILKTKTYPVEIRNTHRQQELFNGFNSISETPAIVVTTASPPTFYRTATPKYTSSYATTPYTTVLQPQTSATPTPIPSVKSTYYVPTTTTTTTTTTTPKPTTTVPPPVINTSSSRYWTTTNNSLSINIAAIGVVNFYYYFYFVSTKCHSSKPLSINMIIQCQSSRV